MSGTLDAVAPPTSDRRSTTLAGILALFAMAVGAFSVVHVVDEAGPLVDLTARHGEVLRGAGAQALMVPASVGFALCLFPILRRRSEMLAAGFLGFRLVAGAFHLVGVILLPLFIVLGDAAVEGSWDPALLEVIGDLMRLGRDLVNHVALILALSLGDLLLLGVLHRWRLVPRWLSVWGIAGTALAIVASAQVLLGVTDVVTTHYLAMNAPLALHGVVLATWLIARGLREPDCSPHEVLAA